MHCDQGGVGAHARQDSGHALSDLKGIRPRGCRFNRADKIVTGDEPGTRLQEVVAPTGEHIGYPD